MPIIFEPLSGHRTLGQADGALRLRTDAWSVAYPPNMLFGEVLAYVDAWGELTIADGHVVPPYPPVAEGITYIGVMGEGSVFLHVLDGNGDGGVTSGGEAYGGGPGSTNGYADAGTRISVEGIEAPSLSAYGFVVVQPPVLSALAGIWSERIDEVLTTDDASDPLPTAALRAAVLATAGAVGTAEIHALIREGLALEDRVAIVFLVLLEEGVVLAPALQASHLAVLQALDRLIVDGIADSYAEAHSLIVDALVFGQVMELLAHERVQEGLIGTADIAELYTATQAVVEAALLGAVDLATHTATAVVSEGLLAGADLASTAELVALAREGLFLTMRLALDTGEYIAWVMNASNRAVTRYTRFPFNAFAKIGGRYYGTAPDGLYALEGDTDAGEPIAAHLRLGLMDFGTRALKRLPEAFLGYTGTGDMLIKVIYSDERSGEKHAAIYRVLPRPAGALRESRAKFGRGLESVDWDFEIHNIDGAQFALESVQFRPLVLERRTRG